MLIQNECFRAIYIERNEKWSGPAVQYEKDSKAQTLRVRTTLHTFLGKVQHSSGRGAAVFTSASGNSEESLYEPKTDFRDDLGKCREKWTGTNATF